MWKYTSNILLYLLNSEFGFTNGNTVHKLKRTPESMKFRTLVHIHHTVCWWWPNPDRIIQETSQSAQYNFKYRQTTA